MRHYIQWARRSNTYELKINRIDVGYIVFEEASQMWLTVSKVPGFKPRRYKDKNKSKVYMEKELVKIIYPKDKMGKNRL